MTNPGREAIRNILSAITHHVIAVSSGNEDGNPSSVATASVNHNPNSIQKKYPLKINNHFEWVNGTYRLVVVNNK